VPVADDMGDTVANDDTVAVPVAACVAAALVVALGDIV